MSGGEIILILLFVLIFFGADKIPEVARGLGKGLREFKKAADEIKSEITRDTADIRSELTEIRSEITNNTSNARQEVEEIRTEILHSSSEVRNEINSIHNDTSYAIYEELKENSGTKAAEADKNTEKTPTDNKNQDSSAYNI